jgi:23S rRNA U2552 (ribose-2'-O)-methylase RlmE/FtsJ
MSYALLPKINIDNDDFKFLINYDISNVNTNNISKSLKFNLNNLKLQINNYNKLWDKYKKFTNPYEYIHTPIPGKNFSICKYIPISRAFYKMIEIIHNFNFLNDNNNIKSFHLAEGPGGFIEAFSYYRNNPNDLYYGITLISNDINVPGWKKSVSFLKKHKNIILDSGKSRTGNLLHKENIEYFYEKYYNTFDYVTGDAGVDYSYDYNNQEKTSSKLILIQILYAIIIQKQGGNFILKIFDIFNDLTIEYIFLLSCLYEEVYIYKPNTSRIANSEKYIICKKYKSISQNNIKYIIDNFSDITNKQLSSILDYNISKLFINKIEEINAIYGQNQIDNISMTLNIIRQYESGINIKKLNTTIDVLNNNNVYKCINWCLKYNLPINNTVKQYYNY